MFGKRWRLFRLAGIPISVDASWLIILALVTMSLSRLFPEMMQASFPDHPEPTETTYLLVSLATAVAFFVCIILHELGHALAARAQKMPIKGITLFLFGGVAELGDEPRSALGEFVVAIAGPIVSLVLAVGLFFASSFGATLEWPPLLVIVTSYLAMINGMVLLFNLIPAFPLDGGRVFRSILWGATGNLRRATYWASLSGRLFAYVLIAWGIVNFVSGNWLGGIWMALIGLFLKNAAHGSYAQVLVRQTLRGEPVARLMDPAPVAVLPFVDLREFVDDFALRHNRDSFPVVYDGRLIGSISTGDLSSTPREEWQNRTVQDVMSRDLESETIAPAADAVDAVNQMNRLGIGRLFVVDGERLVGVLNLKDVAHFLNLKMELDPNDSADGVENGRRQDSDYMISHKS